MTTSLHRLLAVFALLALAACADIGEPREYTKTGDEIPKGPGVLSGEDGEFVIYRR